MSDIPDIYDDFIASDVLAAFIRDTHTYAKLDIINAQYGDGQDHYYLDLEGTLALTPEQAAALSPLFAERPEG